MTDLPIVQTSPWFVFSTELNQVTYGFEFRWNDREGAWYVTLLDGQSNVLVAGRKVVLGPLFSRYRGVPGVWQDADIFVTDTSFGGLDPSYTDLGRRVVLTYATYEEYLAAVDA